MKRFVIVALWSLLLAGCQCAPCCLPDNVFRPSTCCDTACTNVADPVFGKCDGCGSAPVIGYGHTPVSYIGNAMSCGAGCGEMYWGEWISDPPDKCDPCDKHGNWIGSAPCEPKGSWTPKLNLFQHCDCSTCKGPAPRGKSAPVKGSYEVVPGPQMVPTSPVPTSPVPTSPVPPSPGSTVEKRRQFLIPVSARRT